MPLAVEVRVELRRRRRATCPLCLRRRVLYALDAFAPDQPVGYGVAMCLECGGLRRARS